MHDKKVLIAMSGGVDSSVSALLLKKAGYTIRGITMCLGVTYEDRRKCCSRESINDAKRICAQLGIEHHLIDFSKELEQYVIKDFIEKYKNGMTPNPCVECNRILKFEKLIKIAKASGFDYIATGHYAKIVNQNGSLFVAKAKDKKKDQSYFLYSIKREYLKDIIFPLSDLTKEEVRKIAKEENLHVNDKEQSQDICFIKNDYREFLKNYMEEKEGFFIDKEGNILGKHKGIHNYTIGQRHGLGLGYHKTLYVIRIISDKNLIVLGDEKDLYSSKLVAGNLNLFIDDKNFTCTAKIRYNHKPAHCDVKIKNNLAYVSFKEKQRAITPGQSVVFYKDELVLGGGIIQEV